MIRKIGQHLSRSAEFVNTTRFDWLNEYGIKIGATKRLRFTVPFALTGATISPRFKYIPEVKPGVTVPSTSIISASFVEDGITKGTFEVSFSAAQTTLLQPDTYWLEIWLTLTTGDVFCAIEGELEVYR